MDGQWNFRNAYNEARKVRDAQDAFCSKVDARAWDVLEAEGPIEFPDDLQWESLIDVLRGRVKVCPNLLAFSLRDLVILSSSQFTAMKLSTLMALSVSRTNSNSQSRPSTMREKLTWYLIY